LLYAAWNGHVSAVRTFMDKGADVNARNQEGWTPLMCAASKGHVAAAQALLSRGAEAQAKNKEGETARQLAARRDYDDVIKLLQPDEFEE
jgi:ankyrin repeat protein